MTALVSVAGTALVSVAGTALVSVAGTALVSVEEARGRVLANLRATGAEIVGLSEAWGRVTAAPVTARLRQPPADVSAMDGYALRAADGMHAARLRVIGAAPAGHPFTGRVGPGEAVRLFTGSLVPDGADAILLQEDATRDGDWVTVDEAVRAGRHIRRAGQDFAPGDLLVPPGRVLTPRDIGLAAAGNHPWIAVHRRPVVAILATGDEIAMPGEPIPPGGIVSSNSHALAALVRAAGGAPLVLPVAADDREAIGAAAEAAARADVLVTSGGASVGDHDLVLESLGARGLHVDFWKIAMRPGKPLMFGRMGATPVLGLPGNPVSALICAALFLVPALWRVAGRGAVELDAYPPVSRARLGAALPANDHRADHLRARLEAGPDDVPTVIPETAQDSSQLARLARSDALILRPPGAPAAPPGGIVPVLRLAAIGL